MPIKRILIVIGILIGTAVIVHIGFSAWRHVAAHSQPDPNTPEIAIADDQIDFNEENGLLYVNDEVIIMTYDGVSFAQVEDLAEEFRAEIIVAMEDIGFYQLRFRNAMTYDELNRLRRNVREHEIVEDAYFNAVFEVEQDSSDEDEFVKAASFFPDDPWRRSSWNVSVPRDMNWGMEAIHAPAAWGYLDRMETVRIGLIDSLPNTSHEDLTFAGVFVNGRRVTSQDNRGGDQHGTHVAGTMAATYDNSTGVTGVMGDRGELYYSAWSTNTFYTAMQYVDTLRALIDIDVKVINISQNTSRLIGFAASRGNANAVNHLQTQATIAGNALGRMISNGSEFVICVAAGNNNNKTYYPDSKATYGYRTDPTFWQTITFARGERGDAQALHNNFLNLITREDVRSRIIVVGSIGIDFRKSGHNETRFAYSSFSNIGERVDIVGPGESIYSTVANGYESDGWSGTSMATPHVAGVAGLVFASNPGLSGADVKRILLASTTGRFYYTGGYSGLVNAEIAVINALKTQGKSVQQVIRSETSSGLDLCFIVDTTGSMGPYINNAKENMHRILAELSEKSENFRVALIDYRDFAERTGTSRDYPAMLQLNFSADTDEITSAINALHLGHGGDTPETVYSGLMMAAGLDWRSGSQKVIIILGDAPPLDPEPNTGYTFNHVLTALYNADVSIDFDASDDRVLGDAHNSLINVYSIGTSASDSAVDFFADISESTGGSYTGVSDAADVADAIIDSIGQIDFIPIRTVTTFFGDSYSGETVELYQRGDFLFEFVLDDSGIQKVEAMDIGSYEWSIPRLAAGGVLRVSENSRQASVLFNDSPWYAPLLAVWQRERVMVIGIGTGFILVMAAGFVLMTTLRRRAKARASAAATYGYGNAESGVFPGYSDVPGGGHEPKDMFYDKQTPANVRNNAETKTIFVCPGCGAVYDKPAAFCGNCGARM